MTPLFSYYIKVNVALLLFYLLYKAMFSKDTFWNIKRYFWWVTIFFSILYPTIDISTLFSKNHNSVVMYAMQLDTLSAIAISPKTSTFSWQDVLIIFYLLVVVLLLVRAIIQCISIIKIKNKSKKRQLANGEIIFDTDLEISPFSFFNSIFVNSTHFSDAELEKVLQHERWHCQQWHSLDMIMTQLLTISFWLNPFAWLIKREIIINNEFSADQNATQNNDMKEYQYLLLKNSCPNTNFEITNNFYVSPIKKRIIMLNKTKTKTINLVKYFFTLPLAIVMLLLVSNPNQLKADQPTKKDIEEPIKAINITINKKDNTLVIKENGKKTGMKDALIVLNGKIYSKSLESIPPKTIESISILKGKNATERYGDKGKKGVIIISTKEQSRKKNNELEVVSYHITQNDKDDINLKSDKTASPNKVLVVIDDQISKESIDNIAPEKIKEVVVLKGTAAVKEYGEKGENGVVLITTKKNKNKKTYNTVDVQPQFPGGKKAMYKFLLKELLYPAEATKKGIEGKVVCQFRVNKTGTISHIKIVRSIHPLLDQEAIRVIKSMPKWIPAKKDGKNIACPYTFPVFFHLN